MKARFVVTNICEEHNRAWKKYSALLLQSFRDANPDVVPVGKSSRGHCLHHLWGRPCRLKKCDSYRNSESVQGYNFDHAEYWRVPSGHRVIVNQPYGDCTPNPLLAYLDGGTERSWYFPHTSSLFVVGFPDDVREICVTYPVPPVPNALTDCDRYEIHVDGPDEDGK